MAHKKTLVLGASDNPARYSNMAIRKLRAHGHPVIAVGHREGHVGDVAIYTDPLAEADVDTVTLYLSPKHQQVYYNYILSLSPNRIIFNPGTENEELASLAKAHGIQPLDACTLVLLSTFQF